MNLDNNFINYILIAVIIIFVIHMLFKKNEQFDQESEQECNSENIPENIMKNIKCEKKETKNFYDNYYGAHLNAYDVSHNYCYDKNDDVSEDCPIPINSQDVNDYLFDHKIKEYEECPPPVKSIKQFNNDFFSFRDITQQNTTSNIDPVDRITQLYLEDNNDFSRRYPNLKIKDVYDTVTKGVDLHKRKCVRLPDFDNINYDGYEMSYGAHPMHLTRDEWEYENESVMNGGEIKPGLTGYT